MSDDEIMQDRLKIVKEEKSICDLIDALNEYQFKKVERFVCSVLTEDQIDELYFDIIWLEEWIIKFNLFINYILCNIAASVSNFKNRRQSREAGRINKNFEVDVYTDELGYHYFTFSQIFK